MALALRSACVARVMTISCVRVIRLQRDRIVPIDHPACLIGHAVVAADNVRP